MSIIACPECSKKISSRTPICTYCGFQLGDVSETDLEVFRARKLRDRIYRLNMSSYAVITVLVAGFGWFWWESQGFGKPSSAGPLILMGLSALAYLVVRALLFRSRQVLKSMRVKRTMSNDLRRNL
jgi:hypothetical protein